LLFEEEAMDGKRAGKLLLVEDEHTLRSLVAQYLRGEGFDIVEAADGAEAVGFYRERGPFDLVLLDLNLPILCGVEVCRQIKSENPGQPVIVCSAAILDHDIDALTDMQVRQFLSKPFHPLELLERISTELASGPSGLAVDSARSIHPAYRRLGARRAELPTTHALVKISSID
jgi:two-component system phosphate regulon response regulator PhoB